MIPSGFHEHSKHIDPNAVSIISFGVMRSATTWVFQVLRDLFPEGGVIKTHSWLDLPDSIPTVVTYRDFRDVVVSFWRTCNPVASPVRRMSHEEIIYVAGMCRGWIVHLDHYMRRENTVAFRYEDIVTSNADVKWDLEELLEMNISDQWWKYCLERHTAGKNKLLQAFHDTPVLPKDMLALNRQPPGGHIHDGTIGDWVNFVDSGKGTWLLEEILKEPLIRYGYLDSDSN